MSNEELVIEIQSGHHKQANLSALYTQNLPLITKLILPYTAYAELEDLLQESFLGLLKAVEHYDTASGVKFMTYAENWIRQQAKRYTNKTTAARVPEYMQGIIYNYNRYKADYIKANGTAPSKEQYMAELGISEQKYNELIFADSFLKVKSLNEPLGDSEEQLTLADTIADAGDFEQSIVNNELLQQCRKDIVAAVDTLTPRQSHIIKAKYLEDMPLSEIAGELDIHPSTAAQTEKRALRELARGKSLRLLKPYYDELIMEKATATAYRGTLSRFKNTGNSATEKAAFILMGVDNRYVKEL